MTGTRIEISRLRPWELGAVTRMSYANMHGVDREFSRLTRTPLQRRIGYLWWPLYFLLAGRGYKATVDGQIGGYAFLHLRRQSGLIFNVGVNPPFRRRGIARCLLEYLEQETAKAARHWLALQVDRGNRPARQLYHNLGYQVVNGSFWIGRIPPGTPAPGAGLERLHRRPGYRLFRAYQHDGWDAGESWAAHVLKEEYSDMPAGGYFWRCLAYGREVGCAWSQEEQHVVALALAPGYWGELGLTASLLRHLVDNMPAGTDIRLTLSSSGHHLVLAPLLREWGFQEQEQPRLLMLKKLRLVRPIRE